MATLAERLKAETRTAHTKAERSPLIGELLRGTLGRPAYCALLRNLYELYAALEAGLLRHAQHDLISPILFDGLRRREALASDLRLLHGACWEGDLGTEPATTAYVARLHTLADTAPELLLSHAYVRYLGDLSGGQLLRRIVSSSIAARGDGSEAGGTAFYEFGSAEETRRLTQDFRRGIDAVVVWAAMEDALVAEALLAFRMHQRLFGELASRCGIAHAAQ